MVSSHRAPWHRLRRFVAWLLSSVLVAASAADADVATDPGLRSRLFLLNEGVRSAMGVSSPAGVDLSSRLRAELTRASDYFVVGHNVVHEGGHLYLVLVTQTPSNAARAEGFCGAGTEDVMHLIEIVEGQNRLIERDRLLLQSCLKSLSLSDDSGRSLRQRMEAVDDPSHVRVRWLDHPTFSNALKTIDVRQGVLSVK